MAEIRLQNVCKRWGDFIGVDNFDLTIADREFLVLLGKLRKDSLASMCIATRQR